MYNKEKRDSAHFESFFSGSVSREVRERRPSVWSEAPRAAERRVRSTDEPRPERFPAQILFLVPSRPVIGADTGAPELTKVTKVTGLVIFRTSGRERYGLRNEPDMKSSLWMGGYRSLNFVHEHMSRENVSHCLSHGRVQRSPTPTPHISFAARTLAVWGAACSLVSKVPVA